MVNFLKKTKIYNITYLSTKHEYNVSRDRDIISENIIYDDNKKLKKKKIAKKWGIYKQVITTCY